MARFPSIFRMLVIFWTGCFDEMETRLEICGQECGCGGECDLIGYFGGWMRVLRAVFRISDDTEPLSIQVTGRMIWAMGCRAHLSGRYSSINSPKLVLFAISMWPILSSSLSNGANDKASSRSNDMESCLRKSRRRVNSLSDFPCKVSACD